MKTGLELLIYFECFGFVDFSVSEFQSLNIIEFFSVTTSPQWVQDSEFGVQGISACALCRSSSWLTLASVRRRHLTLDTHDTHLPTPTHRQEQPEDVLLSLCPCPTHWHWGSPSALARCHCCEYLEDTPPIRRIRRYAPVHPHSATASGEYLREHRLAPASVRHMEYSKCD